MPSPEPTHLRVDVPRAGPAPLCYRALIETMSLGVEHCDLTGRICYSNAAHHRILGYTPTELVGKYIWDFEVSDDNREHLQTYFAHLIDQQPAPEPFFTRNRRKNGEIIDVQIDWTYDRNSQGRLVGFVAIVVDVTESKRAKAKLIESENKYADLYEHAPDMMCSVDVTSATVVRCNQTLADALGYSKSELIGKSVFQLYHQKCRSRARQAFQLFVATGIITETELEVLCQDGRQIDISLSVSAVKDLSGRVIEVRTTWRDISQRKRAEMALKKSEANLAAAQRIAHLGSWELDLADSDDMTAETLRWSDEVFRIFGYEPGGCAVSNQTFYNAVHPEDRERISEAVAACLSSHSPYKLEHRIVLPDGTERVVYEEGQIIRDPQTAAPLKILGIVQDITERKASEEAIRSSHARLRRVLDSMFAFVGLLTPDGHVIEANRAPLEAAELSREDVIGRPLIDTSWYAHSKQARDALRETIQRAASGKTIRKDFSIQLAGGKIVIVDSIFSPLRNATGEVVEIVSSAVDVTERRQIERDLQRLNEELEQRVVQRTAALNDKNQELEAFAHSVSHDLRAPLRAMEGFATALQVDFGEVLGDEGDEFVEHIISSARQMDALIHDLLAYSRLGRKDIRLEAVSLDAVVADAVAALQQEIVDSAAKVDLSQGMPTVRGHATMLVQSVTNLLSNAIKFVEAGVTPRIRIRAEHRPTGRVRLWVQDNGIGIAKEHSDRVFNVFERLHGVESYPGTGIGLAIVRRACERLGGSCGVDSTAGKGSRFWIELAQGDAHR